MNSWWAQALGALVPLAVAVFAYRASIRANKITAEVEREKVDAAAYDRAQGLYEKSITHLEKRCEQLERQLDLVERENDLQRRQLAEMRARLAAAGIEDMWTQEER